MKPTIIGAVVYSERKFPRLFPEDHNNSQCFVFTKMSWKWPKPNPSAKIQILFENRQYFMEKNEEKANIYK